MSFARRLARACKEKPPHVFPPTACEDMRTACCSGVAGMSFFPQTNEPVDVKRARVTIEQGAVLLPAFGDAQARHGYLPPRRHGKAAYAQRLR